MNGLFLFNGKLVGKYTGPMDAVGFIMPPFLMKIRENHEMRPPLGAKKGSVVVVYNSICHELLSGHPELP